MADTNNTRPEFNPKHRIIGAIVVVALAVIFVPMILNEHEPPPELKDISEIPSPGDTTETKVVVVPVPDAAMKNQPSSEPAPKAEIPLTTVEQPATVVAAPAPPPKVITPAAKAAPLKVKSQSSSVVRTADKITKGWIVQVGTFSNIENAERLRAKLKSSGHAVYAENITIDNSKAVRLRVGPFREKTQAQKSMAQIQREVGLQSALQTYP